VQSLLRYRPYIVCSLIWIIILGVYVVYDRWPRPETIVFETPAATPVPSPEPIVVHISGAVTNPGVYRLASDARVEQAVQAAGGLAPDAQAEVFNLASRISDGQMIYVPRRGETPPAAPLFSLPQNEGSSPTGSQPVNVNTASQTQLEALPCIGPALAGRIIAYREANGPFRALEDLDLVKGIGSACLADLKDLVTF
jgi:competence protein ComEA